MSYVSNQSINWTFKLNDPLDDDIQRLRTPAVFVEYIVFRLSKLDDGLSVLIGFVRFAGRRRAQFVRDFLGAFVSELKIPLFPLRSILSIRSHGDHFEYGRSHRVEFAGGRSLYLRPANVVSDDGNPSRQDESCSDVFARHPRFCIDFARSVIQSTIESNSFEPSAYEDLKPAAIDSEE